MGAIRLVFSFTLAATSVLVLIAVLPGLPPHVDLKPFHIELPKREYLELLESNNILDEAELYYESEFNGIESIVELEDNSIVTSDQSGVVFKITGKQTAINVTQLKYPCSHTNYGVGGEDGDANCGWPLGMRRDVDGNLLLMDYFGGMTKVNMKTGAYTNILPKNTPIDNVVGHVHEDLDVATDGTIYWTDGSTNGDFVFEVASQPSGRLIKYDRKKNTNTVLVNDLHFSNGVCLSKNEDFLLVAEMGSARIRRYYLEGEKKGTNDMFIEGLPGYPDNIRSNGRGGFYVALFHVWNDQYSMRTHLLSPYPLLRRFVLRVRYLMLEVIKQFKHLLPGENIYLNDFQAYVAELRPILQIHERPKTATIAELSNEGKVLNIFHGKSGKIPNLSQVTVGKTYAYMACPFDNKVWRIKLDSLRK